MGHLPHVARPVRHQLLPGGTADGVLGSGSAGWHRGGLRCRAGRASSDRLDVRCQSAALRVPFEFTGHGAQPGGADRETWAPLRTAHGVGTRLLGRVGDGHHGGHRSRAPGGPLGRPVDHLGGGGRHGSGRHVGYRPVVRGRCLQRGICRSLVPRLPSTWWAVPRRSLRAARLPACLPSLGEQVAVTLPGGRSVGRSGSNGGPGIGDHRIDRRRAPCGGHRSSWRVVRRTG